MSKEKIIKTFGGVYGEGQNVLMTALINASNAESETDSNNIYTFLETTPKTSLIVKLYDEIIKLGYKIVKQS